MEEGAHITPPFACIQHDALLRIQQQQHAGIKARPRHIHPRPVPGAAAVLITFNVVRLRPFSILPN